MGLVDDIRKVVQDVVTPDFRALEARVDSIDKKIDFTAKTLNDKIDSSANTLNDKTDSSAKTLNEKIDSVAKTLGNKLDQTATRSELALTRELLVAEMHSMRASFEMTVAKLVMSIDLERRVSKIESERAQEQVSRLEKTA